MYSNNILNFQESTTISNACTKKSGNLLKAPRTYKERERGVGIQFWDICFFRNWIRCSGLSPCGVMAKLLDCDIVLSEFDLHSRCYIHFRTNTLGKGMNPLIPTAMEWNSVINVQQEWLWHWITNEVWYDIKQRN